MEVEINGNEVLRIDCKPLEMRPAQLPFIATLKLPSGKTLTGSLFLPDQEKHWNGAIEATTSFDLTGPKPSFVGVLPKAQVTPQSSGWRVKLVGCGSGDFCSSLELLDSGEIRDRCE